MYFSDTGAPADTRPVTTARPVTASDVCQDTSNRCEEYGRHNCNHAIFSQRLVGFLWPLL